jgi:hypothetical protein
MKTIQQLFDQAVNGIRLQGGPAYAPEFESCMYRFTTEDGRTLKCAIGHLIPDEKYDSMMEGKGIGGLACSVHYETLKELGLLGEGYMPHPVLLALQSAHDQAANRNAEVKLDFMPEFERRVQKIAEIHGLTSTPPAGAQA